MPSGASPTRRTRRWTCGWTPRSPLTAADIVNTYDEAELANILHRYGEERFARRIAAHIVRRRAREPFTSTSDLVALLYEAIPAAARRTGGHPAKRTFQALRVAVNDELDTLRRALPAALDALTVGGRIVVMAYQSLEDRIVKRLFAQAVASRTPVDLPVELPGHEPLFQSSDARRRAAPTPPRSNAIRAVPQCDCGRCNECNHEQASGRGDA